MDKKKYSDEAVFCAKYLKEHGYLSGENLDEITGLIDDLKVEFRFIKVDNGYFSDLASKLRELWPTGMKDDKFPWRDSESNLVIRLRALWAYRNLGEVPIETCLMVARRYLAQYENNTKYMQTLKYFILKQAKVKQNDGSTRYLQKSQFADMLEALSDEDKKQAEWESAFEQSNTLDQDMLI